MASHALLRVVRAAISNYGKNAHEEITVSNRYPVSAWVPMQSKRPIHRHLHKRTPAEIAEAISAGGFPHIRSYPCERGTKLRGGFPYERLAAAATAVVAAITATAAAVAIAVAAAAIAAAAAITTAAEHDQQQNDNPAAVASTKSVVTAHISGPPMN